jgi:hypothetical protein
VKGAVAVRAVAAAAAAAARNTPLPLPLNLLQLLAGARSVRRLLRLAQSVPLLPLPARECGGLRLLNRSLSV